VKIEARNITVTGRVQGVGYRPFVYITAHELGLTGSVLNGSGKVFIHAEGPADDIDRLEQALIHSAPPLARCWPRASRPSQQARVNFKFSPATPPAKRRSTCRPTCSPATIALPS
jgi:hydrogenase maturation protein HypF